MEPSFDTLKERLRAAYIYYRRGKQPNYHGGEDLEKALDPAARNCIAAKITPEDYCSAIYKAYATGANDKFFPNQLKGAKALEVARAFAANYEPITHDKLWDTQLVVLKQALVRTKRSVEDILADQALPFSPWFRIVVTTDPVEKITRRFGREAKAETTPELLAFLARVAPNTVERIKSL